MGSNDIPPSHIPLWIVPTSTALLGVGVVCWCVAYKLMTLETLRTHVYSMPVVALVVNVAWEAVYCFLAVSDASWLEATGIFVWLLYDINLVQATVLYSGETQDRFSLSPRLLHRLLRTFVAKTILVAVVCHWVIASWWLSKAGRGCGDKSGKIWQGLDGYDTTELAFWTASVCQLVTSVSSLSMLWRRQDARGASMPALIWRTAGSVAGLGLANGILWWYWPEAHCYFSQLPAILLNGTALVCDITYGYVLSRYRSVEGRQWPDKRKQGDAFVPTATERTC
ncbi:hypothetical protein CMQ_4451 [Grosmannia clavigera kw1407]|uniref:Integral membrane protein n=1 Tax=Grosmannia clavigera (strain kw1407 / UAMH 11150) TaxID=655863 RepID=F0XV52_GROCL|nr:uncharacterized protein CMQ_4451 [Grosmannia clavigera kw1407]EFW98599.1 hypothetical protein CMQ_4451 [Grosmannia clavigera kw1407]